MLGGPSFTRLLELVGDDTTDEMRLSRVQSLHQTVELFLSVRIYMGREIEI